MSLFCKAIGCKNPAIQDQDFCLVCQRNHEATTQKQTALNRTMSQKYPQYFKRVDDLFEVDVYAVHRLFNIQDPSGAVQHASKKLLLSGVRTGGKSQFKDIQEARDTLNRWLELNPEDKDVNESEGVSHHRHNAFTD